MKLNKGPDGKFIGFGEALVKWLPWMLTKAYGDELSAMLSAAGRWCEVEAAGQLERASIAIKEWDDRGPENWVRERMRQADLCYQRKAVLEECRKKLEALR